jgi:RNA polymerase sigma factor (sigma-70 family)
MTKPLEPDGSNPLEPDGSNPLEPDGSNPLEPDGSNPLDPSGRAHQEDELLVIRCQLGERAAFDELIDRWHGPLLRYVRRMTGQDDAAREVVQDAWLRVLRGISRLRDGARLRPWLFGIARRAVIDRLREKYAAAVDGDVDVSAIAADPVPDDLVEEVAAMQHELSRLPLTEREVLTLFYLRELSLAEVADVLSVPIGTVKSRLFRARQLLRRALETKGQGS